MLRTWIKEPLLHFLLLGCVLFWVFDVLNPAGNDDPKHIQVDRAALLTFMQYRAKQFDASGFAKVLDQLPAEQLQALVEDYVREEALYREAKLLNLDANDAVARQRLIQQLQYITRSFIAPTVALTDDDLQHYLLSHQERYRERAKITFTHVYFSFDRHNQDGALSLARETLLTLNQNTVPFHQGLSYGERFLYHANYVQKEADLVASHFGAAMQDQLFGLSPSDGQWQGPFISDYGAHLVMVTARSEDYDPTLAEVRGRVLQDAQLAQQQLQTDKAIASIVASYRVVLPSALADRLESFGPVIN